MNEWMSKMKNIILYGIITVCLRYNNHNMWMFWVIHSGTIFTHPRSLYYSVQPQPQSQTTPQADQSIPLIFHFCGCAGMVGNAAVFSEMKQQLWLLTIVTTHICKRNFFPLTLIFLFFCLLAWSLICNAICLHSDLDVRSHVFLNEDTDEDEINSKRRRLGNGDQTK